MLNIQNSIKFSLILILCSSIAFAESPSFRVVDMERVVGESELGKQAKEKIEGLLKSSQEKVSKIKEEISSLETSLQKQSTLLSSDALRGRREEVDKRRKALAREYNDLQEDIAKKNSQEIGKVVAEADKIITEISNKQKYDFVVEKNPRFVVYADGKLEITDQVIESLNKKVS